MSTPTPSLSQFRRVSALAALLLAALIGSSCNSADSNPPKYFVQFYMEAPENSGIEFTLPVSGLKYRRQTQPFLTGVDVRKVTPSSVEAGGIRQITISFQFDIFGQHELYIQTANHMGSRIFLFANDDPMGVRYIDQVVEKEDLFVFIEISDLKKLEDFVTDLQASQERIKEMKDK